jgi:hypothetical protein
MASNKQSPTPQKAADMSCANCGLRKRAEHKPNSLIARLWRWHTGWCPGWKAYQTALASEG